MRKRRGDRKERREMKEKTERRWKWEEWRERRREGYRQEEREKQKGRDRFRLRNCSYSGEFKLAMGNWPQNQAGDDWSLGCNVFLQKTIFLLRP